MSKKNTSLNLNLTTALQVASSAVSVKRNPAKFVRQNAKAPRKAIISAATVIGGTLLRNYYNSTLVEAGKENVEREEINKKELLFNVTLTVASAFIMPQISKHLIGDRAKISIKRAIVYSVATNAVTLTGVAVKQIIDSKNKEKVKEEIEKTSSFVTEKLPHL